MEWWKFVHPDKWATTPIPEPVKNPRTGNPWGDDSGYRGMRTLTHNPSPLVVPDFECVPVYHLGLDVDGTPNPSMVLKCGVPDGKQLLRVIAAKAFKSGDVAIQKVTGKKKRLRLLDGFRDLWTQQAGFNSLALPALAKLGVDNSNVMQRVQEFVEAGRYADITFSWVPVDKDDPGYATLVGEIQSQIPIDLTAEFIDISANTGIGPAATRNLRRLYDKTEHGGGGVGDVVVVNDDGTCFHPSYFDSQGVVAAIGFTGKDENFDLYRKMLKDDARLWKYVQAQLKIATPDDYQWKHWEAARSDDQLLHHAMCAVGCLFYGGEFWHKPASTQLRDPFTGKIVEVEEASSHLGDSGSVGRAIQTLGPEGTAAWGGISGHEMARAHGLVF